jgi:hypothetical protein
MTRDWLYQTPDKKYAICKSLDSMWTEIFGHDVVEYLICKFDKSLAEWANKNPTSKISDYFIFRSEETMTDCFRWLEKKGIITKQEADEQIRLYS